MAVYKEEKTGTWRVIYRYTDWTGEKKQTQKRGFQTKREAQAWEREQLNKATAALDMPCSFCYYANMACKPIFAFHAIYHFAFLYRTMVFTHNFKKNR